eukprot:c19063_g1_i1.p1 GENE.c19063_g1_i1~~c19063_g1_i1.p1  ORF type:complete len:257 (+),score=65.09 c19063_g1_i1:606-1376(+)
MMSRLYLVLLAALVCASNGGGVNVTSLSINPGSTQEAKITLGDADEAFSLVMDADGSFVVRHRNEPTFSIDSSGAVSIAGEMVSAGAVKIEGSLNYMGVEQWFLAAIENFNEGTSGWSNSSTSTCGNQEKVLLGGCGKFAGGEVSKIYAKLPPHNTIRVTANFHFIDNWGGETAYAKFDNFLVWTEVYDQQSAKSGVNICCGDAPEGKFSNAIDVSMPHSADSLKLTFGTTLLADPMTQSWALSDVQVFVRSSNKA